MHTRPSRSEFGLLFVVVLAVSTAGPLFAAASAPIMLVAFWRGVVSTSLTLPFAFRNNGWRKLTPETFRYSVLAGIGFALHLGLWVPSVQMTTIAASSALVATQPMWSAFIAAYKGQKVSGQVWLGIAIALAGVLAVVGLDFQTGMRAITGDLLALGGAISGAFYLEAGSHVRKTVPTSVYTSIVYVITTTAMLSIVLLQGVPVTNLNAHDWLLVIGLTIGPQFLGHSLMSRLVLTVSPIVIGVAVLMEAPGATIIAALLLGQGVGLQVVLAIAVILLGVGLVATANSNKTANHEQEGKVHLDV